MTKRLLFIALFCAGLPARAQDTADTFTDGPDGAKLHAASGFVCPQRIGAFERDAVGERDPRQNADFCAYSALDGVYGTIVIQPLPKTYDPGSMLAPDFEVQERTGGKVVGEATRTLGSKVPRTVYTRTYEMSKLATVHYQTVFASAAAGSWAIEVIVEYASPRNDELEKTFLDDVFARASSNPGG